MDVWQSKRQLAFLLSRATWADSPDDVVLTEAFVSEDLEGNFLPGDFLADGPPKKTPPFARVARLPARHDGESLDRLEALALRAFVTAGAGGVTAAADGETAADKYDTHGENQVDGSQRGADGAGGSTGRDVDEVVDRLVEGGLGDGQLVDSQHGLQGEVLDDLEADPVDGVQVLSRPLDVVVYNATRGRSYHTVYKPTGVKSGSNAVFTWTPGPLRFDSLILMVRRAPHTGDPAPVTPTDVGSVLVSDACLMPTAVGVTDTAPGAGTWNYSIFSIYAETPAGWPTFTIQGLTLALWQVAVTTAAAVTVFTMAPLVGATTAATATNLAAAINADPVVSLYAIATASGSIVTLEPITANPWVGVATRQNGGAANQVARNNGDRYVRRTLSVTI